MRKPMFLIQGTPQTPCSPGARPRFGVPSARRGVGAGAGGAPRCATTGATGRIAAASMSPKSRTVMHPFTSGLLPDLTGRIHDQLQFAPLVFFAQEVAFHGGGEAALRADGEVLDRHEAAGLLDAADQQVP